jgi:hypothetical protein
MPGPSTQPPVIDVLGRDALLGLTYRALAADAEPAQAQLTLRRIEHTASDYTVLAQKRSQLRSALEIAKGHARDAQREATRLDLDLQLFNERYPPPPVKRGLFAPKRTAEQQKHDAVRAEQQQQLGLARQDAGRLQAKADELDKQAHVVDELYARITVEREEQNGRFRREVAAGVLSLVALGHSMQAREVLAEGRRMLRGDLVLGALWVLVALFSEGAAAAERELKETQLIWEQHPDPVSRVLQGYLKLLRGERLTYEALGVFPRVNFSHAGLWRLYLLLGALAGWPTEHDAPDSAGLWPTLRALWYYASQGDSAEWELRDGPHGVAEWAGQQDIVCRTLVANLLLRTGRTEYIPHAAGFGGLADIPPLHYIPKPKRTGDAWPELLPLLAKQPLPDWPLPLHQQWTAALACHTVIAAQIYGPSELYAQWLAESHGWPVSNLHWWTQAQLRSEPGILSNLRADEPGLIRQATAFPGSTGD